MINFIVLILVSIVIMQSVDVLNKIKDYFVNKDWIKAKFSIPFAVILGAYAGTTLNVGVIDSILKMSDIKFTLPLYFGYFDIFVTCLLLTQGSTVFVDLLKKFQELKTIKK